MTKYFIVGMLLLGMTGLTGVNAFGQYVYWADANFGTPSIGRSDLNGNNVLTLTLASQSLPQGLALDHINNTILSGEMRWSNARTRRTTPNFSSVMIVDSSNSVIRGIVADATGTKLYWTTSNLSTGSKIHTSLIDGTNQQVLYSFTAASGANLRGITLNGSTLYWADFGTGKIQSGNITGSPGPSDLVTGLSGPVGIALGGDGYIYWTEATGNFLKRRLFAPSTVEVLLSGLSTPNYLAIDPTSGKMFWTEIGIPRIRKADLAGTNMQTLPMTVVNPSGIVATSSPLPVQLVSFSGVVLSGGNVELTWRTISEVNNYGFYVQRRSENEPSFTELANSFVAGNGTTNIPKDYSYTDSTAGPGSWFYRLKQVDLDGTIHFADPIRVDVLTGVKEDIPTEFSLEQNYPNPFNPSTEIRFSVKETAHTRLEVFNMLGQSIAKLFEGVAIAGQYHSVQFDASAVSSGIYFYRLQSGNAHLLKKLVVTK